MIIVLTYNVVGSAHKILHIAQYTDYRDLCSPYDSAFDRFESQFLDHQTTASLHWDLRMGHI